MNTRRTKFNLGSVIILLAAAASYAAVIDFEQVNSVVPFEGMTISNQFRAHFGISFRRRESVDSFPVIAKFGGPSAAFTLSNGADDRLTVPNASDYGDFFLTDDAGSQSNGTGIILDFAEPVSQASGYLFDVEGRESVTIVAYGDSGGTSTLDTKVFNSGSEGTGNGKVAQWSFSRTDRDIRRIDIISNNAEIGYDSFSSDYAPPAQAQPETGIKMYPGVTIRGDVGRPYRLDYADKLDVTPAGTNWHALKTIFLPSSPYLYLDLSATNTTGRFYQAVAVP